jgi:hypothetical protein
MEAIYRAFGKDVFRIIFKHFANEDYNAWLIRLGVVGFLAQQKEKSSNTKSHLELFKLRRIFYGNLQLSLKSPV